MPLPGGAVLFTEAAGAAETRVWRTRPGRPAQLLARRPLRIATADGQLLPGGGRTQIVVMSAPRGEAAPLLMTLSAPVD